MLPPQPIMEQIIARVERLPAEDRVRLIQRPAEMLIPVPDCGRGRRVVYAEIRGQSTSTDEVFKIADRYPPDRGLNGQKTPSR